MVKAIETLEPHAAGVKEFTATAPRPRNAVVHRLLAPIASLRLTVVLFVLSLVLVFASTLAQMHSSNFTVVQEYFRSFYVWVPLQLFVQFAQIFFGVSSSTHVSGSLPFPGGWVVGGLLLVNLLAAHAVRFKLSWRRTGILLIHSGLVVLMLGELITGLFAVEARMSLAIGETVSFVDVAHKNELAITTSVDEKNDHVTVIPDAILRQGGVIQNELLPVDVEVVEFMDNSDLLVAKPGDADAAEARTADDGRSYVVVKKSEESGTDTNARDDAPAVRVRIRKRGTAEVLGTQTLSLWHYPNFTNRMLQIPPEQFTLDGKTYTVEFRRKREYKPYALHLKEFHHDRFIGTDTPKNFSSLVRLVDQSQSEDRDANIYMNHPLRHSGETLYQSGYFPNDQGTVLQVVRNPAWTLPYISCTLVSLGMIVHFGLHLVGFLQRKGVA